MSREVKVLAEGIYFGEGPRWHDGRLWFSDFYDHAVKTVGPDGSVDTRLVLDDQPSGLGWLPDGTLLVVAMHSRSVLRFDGEDVVVHARLDDVATFHCNDMVVDERGRAWVGNFGYDRHAGESPRTTSPGLEVENCMICTKFALKAFGSFTVGVPPVHEIEIAWLLRLLVWFTVKARLENVPRPLTVTCDDVGGSRVSEP